MRYIHNKIKSINAYKVVEMTFEAYDQLVEQLNEIDLYNEKPYWPSPEDFRFYQSEQSLDQVIRFAIWLLEKNGNPETEEEIESKKYLKEYLLKHLSLIDDEVEMEEIV